MTKRNAENLVKRAKEVIKREAEAVAAICDQLDVNIKDIVDILLNCKGHILVAGAGTSRAVAQRFAHLLACCGAPGLAVNAADALCGGAGAIKQGDVVFAISKGGHSNDINRFIEVAKSRGAKIIAQTENPDSPLAKMSDAVFQIKTVGDVDPYGMIATGCSIVNSAATDVLCILLLELSGYSKERFSVTHPEGAVGKRIADEKRLRGNVK